MVKQFTVVAVRAEIRHGFKVDWMFKTDGLIAFDANTITFTSFLSIDLKQALL
ncbi:hypothetical protein [Prochlorococcus marinus]|uniref:hypothetical protein n=1 Tax=Prochlorococcus sp. MIT 1323 TaxID=3082526 RepID=UPI0018C8652F